MFYQAAKRSGKIMKVTFASVSMNVKLDKAQNLSKILNTIDQAAEKGADLIVFPEQCLQGYLTNVVGMDMSNGEADEFNYQYQNAELVPEGPSVQSIAKKAQEKGVYVTFGMTEKDSQVDYKLYNTAVLVGPEGYIGKYRKVHQPADEIHVYYGGDSFPVFETKIGKIGMLICYDKWFPETTRELVLNGADILALSTATAFSDPEAADYDTDYAFYTFELMDRVRALENQTFFVGANQVEWSGKSRYFGNSKIVAPNGRVVAQTGFQEGIAYYTTEDLQEETFDAKHCFAGLNFLKDRHPSLYGKISADSVYSNYK